MTRAREGLCDPPWESDRDRASEAIGHLTGSVRQNTCLTTVKPEADSAVLCALADRLPKGPTHQFYFMLDVTLARAGF